MDFYQNNLDYSGKPTDYVEGFKGFAAGVGRSIWGGVQGLSSIAGEAINGRPLNAFDSVMGPLVDPSVDTIGPALARQQGKAFVSGLQGNTYESVAQGSEILTTGASFIVPGTAAGRLGQASRAGETGAVLRLDEVAVRGNSVGEAAIVPETSSVFGQYIRDVEKKGPCCFAAGTKVSTPNGDRTIESLKVGDVVWSKPEKGGKPFAAKILATHQRSDQPIYRLQLKSVRADGTTAAGETLLVTPSHPFYVPAKRDFIPVINLKPGDLLQSLADGDSENTSSEVESLELYLPVGKTYNLTVDVGHTFYVGELKTWVHNTGPCDLPEGYLGASAGGKVYADEATVGSKADGAFYADDAAFGAKEVADPNATGGTKVGPGTDLTPEIKQHSDGSYRTPDGKFASPTGLAPPGTVKADEFAKHLESNGMEVVGTEMVVKGPLGDRRYDIVVRDASGKLHGLEVKSGTANKTSYQEFTDYFVNEFGAQGKGRLKGEVIESATTVYVP
ncbi:Hint domain-containing protein [Pseudomonas viridiflava]|uniref:Hint domain-containing protein n=1 Tax=Pseudomonas viridiflava TaxID=33069 RepID=UPI001F12FB7D|nr:Hint domain-containing protein [Pseudomonas viridiflava]